MWNSTAYGSGSGYGGGFGGRHEQSGGFINTSNIGSPGLGSQNENRRVERVNNVVPCTVAMIVNSDENEELLKVGSMAAYMLTVVGMVRSVDEQSTRIIYTLDDMTGPPLEIQLWLGESDEITSEVRSSTMENTYIRVTGHMRTVKGKRLLVAFKVSPVRDVNDITMHLLEVMHTSMAVALMDKRDSTSNTNNLLSTTHSHGMSANLMHYNDVSMEVDKGLNRVQQMVLQVISSRKDPAGCSFNEMFSSLKSLKQSEIRAAVEFLSNEGHIYSSIDDDHYLPVTE